MQLGVLQRFHIASRDARRVQYASTFPLATFLFRCWFPSLHGITELSCPLSYSFWDRRVRRVRRGRGKRSLHMLASRLWSYFES